MSGASGASITNSASSAITGTGPLRVLPLTTADAPVLSAMLLTQPASYMQYFIPFGFDEATVFSILGAVQSDVYMGLYWGAEVAGFFMLRGWDAGYTVPAYGVTISDTFKGKRLGRLTLELSKSISLLRGATRLMLKVHPENSAAKHLYESCGFVQTGFDAHSGNLIMHYDYVQ